MNDLEKDLLDVQKRRDCFDTTPNPDDDSNIQKAVRYFISPKQELEKDFQLKWDKLST